MTGNWRSKVLEQLRGQPVWMRTHGLIVEASLSTKFDYLEEYGFFTEKVKQYKTNQHVFIRKAPK